LGVVANQSQVGFVNESRGVERLSGRFLGQFMGGQPPQLVVNQGKQLTGCLRVALLDGLQDSLGVGHEKEL
jgi:hypothetical protein